MPVPKWYIIAKNEYRTITGSIRGIRPYFPYLIIGFLAFYVGYITPKIMGYFIETFQAFIITIAAVAVVEILLFMFFFYFIMMPISVALKDIKTGELEIFLSAPVKPSDVLLGTFMGQLPFYAVGITLLTGIFTGLLQPLGLDIIQITIIVLIFVLTLLSAVWIGVVIAAILRTKLGKIARGRDIGKALSLIIALPMIAVMYALMGGGLLQALADPDTSALARIIMGIFPSSWGAELIIEYALNPGDWGAVWFMTLTRFGGIVLFFIGTLWVGAKLADRAYSLELTSLTASTAKPDGRFYHTIRNIGGGESFGTFLVAVFKDYGRRFENLSKIAYFVGLIALILIFVVRPEEPFDILIMVQIIFAMFAGIVVGEVTLRGKEALFIFRKAPNGVDRLVMGRLIHGWLVVVPIVAVILILILIQIPGTSLLEVLAIVMMEIVIIQAFVAMALGLALLKPAFVEKESFITPMMLSFMAMMLFIFPVIIFGMVWGILASMAIFWIAGIILLFMGRSELNYIE